MIDTLRLPAYTQENNKIDGVNNERNTIETLLCNITTRSR